MPQLTATTAVALAVTTAVALAVPAAPALAAPAESTGSAESPGSADRATAVTVMTPATGVAARSDRRPVAGGVHDARADTTFITWAGQFEDNYIQAYDHRTGAWSAPVRVGDGGNDSHNYPTIVQADDGHLLVFRSLHNTELRVARSATPHSIDGTWTDTVIPEGQGATYPMPFKAADGSIFVFIRETAGDFDKKYPTDFRPMTYVRSTDNGLTWQSSEQLTGDRWTIAPQDRPDNMNEIYIGQLRHEPAVPGRPERVGIAYTLAGGGPEGHLHDRYHKNVYYTYFTPSNLRFHAADGRDLGTRIDDPEQERYLKVADTALQTVNPRSPDYISLVGSVAGRAPFVVWMRLDPAGVLHDEVAVHTPWGWRSTEVATGVRVRDMEQVDPLTWRVYATVEGATSGIATYLLTAGTWWRPESVIGTPKAVQRIEVIGGYRDPARILASGGSSARDVSVADGDIYVAGRRR
ncbi:BNR-4 repeat-containing protein [Planosporangium sp. 12N6]|uniref:BNR-4 repeat-containing protein n=1 Tax=Planosporangium spinosum TaxID=3402278 RepID=UPI003CEA3FEE